MQDDTQPKADHEPPHGASTSGTWNDVEYTAAASWLVLRTDDTPSAEIFSVSYVATGGDRDRPVTFVFNGGPGASSAYLHVGLAGPQRVEFPADGSLPSMPPRLVHNEESWLGFTDLVFVDPVGTGFSRVIDAADPEGDKGGKPDRAEYFAVTRDLESMGEFMSGWLSRNGRWGSPVLIAGESYGGYRTERLTRMLHERTGIGLSGALLISPALEFGGLAALLGRGDYEVLPWVDLLPSMALTAVHHGRSRAFGPGAAAADVRRDAEEFATGDLAVLLTRGASMPADERARVLARHADLLGLDPAMVERAGGRVRVDEFARELLRDERKVLGRYDGTVTTTDPFPDRASFEGADPTLTAVLPVYSTAVNQLLRSTIGVETDREYRLLNPDVVLAWKDDASVLYNLPVQGATDDLRYGMAVNPRMKAFIAHGRYDLITPYYASERLRNLMRLDPSVAERLTVRHVEGGHMFYAWQQSRREFTAAVTEFVADATAG